MIETRRKFLKKFISTTVYLTTLTSGVFYSISAKATWPSAYFRENSYRKTLKELFGDQKLIETSDIQLKLPKIAENGAVVPVIITSKLENTQSITILADKNPVPLIAQFNFADTAIAYVSARIKMAETSNVVVIAKAGDNYYFKKRKVKVTIGGCGG